MSTQTERLTLVSKAIDYKIREQKLDDVLEDIYTSGVDIAKRASPHSSGVLFARDTTWHLRREVDQEGPDTQYAFFRRWERSLFRKMLGDSLWLGIEGFQEFLCFTEKGRLVSISEMQNGLYNELRIPSLEDAMEYHQLVNAIKQPKILATR